MLGETEIALSTGGGNLHVFQQIWAHFTAIKQILARFKTF